MEREKPTGLYMQHECVFVHLRSHPLTQGQVLLSLGAKTNQKGAERMVTM